MFTAFAAALLLAPGPDELAARRRAVLEKVSDGVLLLHSASALGWEASSFRQDANFYYLTGLPNAQRAVLVLDGPAKQSWLFVGRVPDSTPFAPHMSGRDASFVSASATSEQMLGIDHVVPLEGLDGFLANRRKLSVFLDAGSFLGSLPGREDSAASLRKSAHERWPQARLEDATAILQTVRAVKTDAEIASLRKAAGITLAAFRAGVAAIRPGERQRHVEAAVASACFADGGEGPSFWPWVRTGAQAGPASLYESMADYHNLDRTLAAGELVRLDLGCEYDHYKADFGRTVPVSGRFDEGQREALTFLERAYRTGLAAIRPGRTPDDVNRATTSYVLQNRASLKTSFARDAAAAVNEKTTWFLHGIGLDLLEDPPRVFEAGNVVCFEPRLTAHDQSVFVEDTFVVTADGHRQLSPPLPTSADEIEREMAKGRRR